LNIHRANISGNVAATGSVAFIVGGSAVRTFEVIEKANDCVVA